MLDPELTPQAFVKLCADTAGTPAAPTLLDVREPWEAANAAIPLY